jgi:small-conductance mechanosensitive channel
MRPESIGSFVTDLLSPSSLLELGAAALCLLLAWSLVRAVRGPLALEGSIWFGQRIVDGVLFPVTALLLAMFARWLLERPPLELTITVFRFVLPILVSLVVIRLVVRVLHQLFPTSALMRAVERSVSWAAWIAVVLWVTGLLPLLLRELDAITWRIGGTPVSLRNLLEGGLTAALVLMAALWVSAALEARLLKGATDNLSVRKMAANLLRALLILVGLMFALSAAGIDLTALSVLGGALGVGIGLGLQRLAANYVSGFVILAERSMRIGDLVRVDTFEGRITDISARYTVIRAINGRESIVPNEMMITQRVENITLADSRMLLNTVVQVAYGTDVQTLMPQMLAAVASVPRVMADPGPGVLLTNFAADGLELTVGFWIADPENGQGNVRSDVNLAILRLFGELGVEIPFPQRVLHAPPATATVASPLGPAQPTGPDFSAAARGADA